MSVSGASQLATKEEPRVEFIEHPSGGAWRTAISTHTEVMDRGATEQGIDVLNRFSGVFPGANTWVAKTHGVPSLFVRIDCVVVPSGELKCYEVEERPCGIGMTMRHNHFFAERFSALLAKWPAMRWVMSEHRATDDELWCGRPLSVHEAKQHDGMLLVRSRPEEVEFHELEDRAVSSVSQEGNKDYGLTFNWWSEVEAVSAPEGKWCLSPPPSEPCVFKPKQGTRSRHVKAYIPGPLREEMRTRIILPSGDCESLSQITRLVRDQPDQKMYCQPLVEPMRFPHQPTRNAIYRMFYGFDPDTGWQPLGGVWMALDSVIVHGTDRTITGSLTFET